MTQTFQGGFGNTGLLEQASPAGYIMSGTTLPPFYILYAEDELLNLTEQNVMFKNQLETSGFDVTASYLAGYSHVTEMEAIGDVSETPTQLIVNWIQGLLQVKLYLPLLVR